MAEERGWSHHSLSQNEASSPSAEVVKLGGGVDDVQGKRFGRAQASKSLDPMSVPLWGRGRYNGGC